MSLFFGRSFFVWQADEGQKRIACRYERTAASFARPGGVHVDDRIRAALTLQDVSDGSLSARHASLVRVLPRRTSCGGVCPEK